MLTKWCCTVLALRAPKSEDGMSVFRLIAKCPPLDQNSVYCNLLQCSHFADTSVVAEYQSEFVGFISGYIIPERNDTLFIWQVAVAGDKRGMGIANKMLQHILNRPSCAGVSNLETTITESNQASRKLFRHMANNLGTGIQESIMFDHEAHFNGSHDSEFLMKIGPFTAPSD